MIYGAILTAIILSMQGIGFKLCAKKCGATGNDYLFNTISFALGLIVIICISVFTPFDCTSFLYGLGCGVIFCTMIFAYNQALKRVNIAYVNFFALFAMIIPITASALVLQEIITVYQYVSFGLMVVAAYLVCLGKTKLGNTSAQDRKTRLFSIFTIIAYIVFNGLLSLYIKLTNHHYQPMQWQQFVLGMFLLSFIAMIIGTGITTRGYKDIKSCIPNKWYIITAIGVGIVTIAGNIMFNYFSVRLNGAIFYPITSALPMLIGAGISPLFGEKLSLREIMGILVGVTAVVLVNF
ncbi:MAG: hypothetical protein PHW00_00770 [Clostridia bacterium]|nr:hypothetical protein [Clostridia bacterium]